MTKTTKWIVFGIGGAVAAYFLYQKFLAGSSAPTTAVKRYAPAPSAAASMPLLPVTVRNNPASFIVTPYQITGTGAFANQRWTRSGNTWIFSTVNPSPITATAATAGTSAVAGLEDDNITFEGDCL